MNTINNLKIESLRKAFKSKNLTIYLGAGISTPNGLPSWEKLVLAMYFKSLKSVPLGNWRPFPNYLFAISEWYLDTHKEALEITARKIRKNYSNQDQFHNLLKDTLYAAYKQNENDTLFDSESILNTNHTLNSIVNLCKNKHRGILSIITYNYDNLLETALGDFPYQTIWKNHKLKEGKLPIYHVHGYIPYNCNQSSKPHEIVFTEDQYHKVAHDPYYWSNLVQIKHFTSSIGLMIGLSLSDRNMRRLLDAINKAPIDNKNYILLQKPKFKRPIDDELDEINKKAIEYINLFERSGIKSRVGEKGLNWKDQITGIIEEVNEIAIQQHEYVLNQFGITILWYKEHSEIPNILEQIT